MKNKKLFAILTLVCFMFTLMPVAAFAATEPCVWVKDGDQTLKFGDDGVARITLETTGFDAGATYLFFAMKDDKLTEDFEHANEAGAADGFYYVDKDHFDGNNVELYFTEDGEYTLYVVKVGGYENARMADKNDGTMSPTQAAKAIIAHSDNIVEFENNVITVKGDAVDPANTYTAQVFANLVDATDAGLVNKNKTSAKKEGTFKYFLANVEPNNVFETDVKVQFKDGDDALKGKTVNITTNSSAIEVSKETAKTSGAGYITFQVAANTEGDYEIDLELDGIVWTLKVQVGNTAATYIKTVTEPTAPQALYGNDDPDFIEFEITDINGNIVKDSAKGMDGIQNNGKDVEKYVVVTEAPADSNLESGDLTLTRDGDVWIFAGDTAAMFDAEGDYAVKVILDNGAYATAKWTVKKFQTPVQLIIGTSTNTIELGASVYGELKYADANGVVKAAKDAELTATGYAVAAVVNDYKTKAGKVDGGFYIQAKSDEKYVGATIATTAVSEKYDLVATKEFKVADGAVAIAFVDKAADVNVNNTIEWNVVDSTDTRVALSGVVNEVKYVVLDKPADAKVSVTNGSTADLASKGIGYMKLTSNKVGNVTVQVVVKATAAENTNKVADQVKYYTGTQIIAVGTQGVGDVVVMSIGSNEIVINDAKGTIDAAPIVENNRTFVPFRALAEAFGATVAYDEATQAVTAELNGVTVVMTIGSAEYTVNGEAATADVAPFINGSRTMVPVRFVAEAFGIKVIPTYDENGATADILFNL